jgi:heat shock protein HtpX
MLLDDQIRWNKRRTVVIVLLMLVMLALVVAAVGILLGLPWYAAALFAGLAAFVYFLIAAGSGVNAILAAARARPANPNVREEKLLLYKVEELAIASGLPQPKVYVQESRDINAFAAGKNPSEAVVCVTTGALQQLNQQELEGVLAHELAHIKNYDVRLATYTLAVVGIIAILAELVFRVFLYSGGRAGHGGGGKGGGAQLVLIILAVLFVILAPILSRLVYLSLSRRREYLADASGAYMTRNPEGLASALEKILHDLPDDPKGSKTVAALYIANPWKRALRESLWSSHPPLPDRIRRLRGPAWRPEASRPARAAPAPPPTP